MSQAEANDQTAKKRAAQPFFDLLNGRMLSGPRFLEQLPFLLFICGLSIVYIGYGYFTESTVKQIYRADQELKELKAEYLTTQAGLQQIRQQSRIADAIQDMGLTESVTPPRKILVERAEQNSRRP